MFFRPRSTALGLPIFFILGELCATVSALSIPILGAIVNPIVNPVLGVVGVDTTYDYVIVGGGTAGLAMAARLSENSQVTVAVVEAGDHYQLTSPVFSTTPAADVMFVGADPADTNPMVDWNFVTQPQAGANARTVHYARGKTLGGCSARNFMIYQRGTKQSFSKWASQVNDSSYEFDAMMPYFKKSINFTPPDTVKRGANASAGFTSSSYTPSNGPVHVSFSNYGTPFSTWMQKGMSAIGIPTAADFNQGSLMGAQFCTSTIDPNTEMRESSETSFLKAASGRSNLAVYSMTLAKNIIFDGTKKATGVKVATAGVLPYTLKARKEVIVSAGAFQSPQLLMVSGVGPAAQLQKFGIPVIANRSGVGQNMQDHVFFGPTYRVGVDTLTKIANDPVYLASEMATNYMMLKQGPLTNPVADFLAWEKVPADLRANFTAQTNADLATFPPDWPEIEYMSGGGYVGNFANLFTTQPKDGYQYATILAALVAPMSRGTVALQSADTSDLPLIDPRWLTSPTDQQVAIAAYKRARAAFTSSGMSPITVGDEYYPGLQVQTDDQILAQIKNDVMTVWHASCTCAMGRKDDPMAVVDSAAKVIGVSGLRVVDASAFPILPPGHPQSAVYALAEKIADMIKKGQ